jgi:hypothetical protein
MPFGSLGECEHHCFGGALFLGTATKAPTGRPGLKVSKPKEKLPHPSLVRRVGGALIVPRPLRARQRLSLLAPPILCECRHRGLARRRVAVGPSFDHLVGQCEHRGREFNAEGLRGLEVDHEFKFRRLLDG